MKDFKNYIPPDNDKNSCNCKGGKCDKQNCQNNVNPVMDLVKNMSASMKGKSESQLIQSIILEAEKGKKEGRLTNADLDNFFSTLSPLLDSQKRKKLQEVITRLKNL